MSAWWPWPLFFTLKLVRIITRGVDNIPTNFGVSRTFCSRLIGQHLSDASRNLATLTFDLGGHGACCWCRSSCFPFGRYAALPVSTLCRLCDLCLWPWNWCALLPVGWTTFLPILVFGLWPFDLILTDGRGLSWWTILVIVVSSVFRVIIQTGRRTDRQTELHTHRRWWTPYSRDCGAFTILSLSATSSLLYGRTLRPGLQAASQNKSWAGRRPSFWMQGLKH